MTVDILHFYASQLSWPLFPCSNHTKAPLTPHGFKDATADLKQIEEWYRQFPGCAWGTPTSAKRGVIDIDPRHGGDVSLARLQAQHGPIPLTPKVRTGGGGFHYWLRFPPGTPSGKVADGVDRKAEGGYVIVPPSRIDCPEHQARAYAWEPGFKPYELPLAAAPAWCLGSQPKPKAPTEEGNPWIVRPSGDDLLTHPGCGHGQRRDTFCRLAGVHLNRGDSVPSIRQMAAAWAEKCSPPFTGQPGPDDHWEKHLAGLLRKEEAKGLRMTTPSAPDPVPPPVPSHSVATITEYRDDTLLEPGREENNSAPALVDFPSSTGEGDNSSLPTIYFPPSPPCGEGGQAGDLLSSLPPCGDERGASGALSAEWPILPPDAWHGLLGEMLQAVGPYTEADPSGVLLAWLTCFGSVVGRGAWVNIGPRLHLPALYVGIVATTGMGKGDAWAVGLWPFEQVEPEWKARCIANGVGSGEGLLERVADEQQVLGKDGKVQVIPGAADKRCLLRLSELSKCFKLGRRENATLSDNLKEAWDGTPIHVPNRKANAISSNGYAISVFGDIQPHMLRKLLDTGTEAFDGFANRFLWAVNRGENSLDDGGSMEPLRPFLDRLSEALAFAKQAGLMTWDEEAARLRKANYDRLRRSGDSIPHTDRMRAYVWRLAMLYALVDGSKVIRAEHYRAALAVVEYCRASAALLFGGRQDGPKEPDPLWLRLLNAILRSPGINRTALREVAGHKVKAEEIEAALAILDRDILAYRLMVKPQGKGSPAECWFPVLGPVLDGDGVSLSVDNPALPPPETPSADADAWGGRKINPSRVADADGGSMGREENKYPVAVANFLPPSPGGEQNAIGVGEPNFLPPSPIPEQQQTGQAKAEAEAGVMVQGEAGVVNQKAEAVAYVHEPEGGLGMASGKPVPNTTEPFLLLGHQSGEVRRACFRADQPPADEAERLRRRQEVEAWWQGLEDDADASTEDDDFLRRLAGADAT